MRSLKFKLTQNIDVLGHPSTQKPKEATDCDEKPLHVAVNVHEIVKQEGSTFNNEIQFPCQSVMHDGDESGRTLIFYCIYMNGTAASNPTQWSVQSPDTIAASSQKTSTKSICKSAKVSNIAGPTATRDI